MRAGAIGWATDVCVPISRLAECIAQTHVDLETSSVPATILGHVGDGNFHVIFSIDPSAPEEMAEVEAINARLVERALAMDRSEEHTSELQSLMRISYAVFCLKKNKHQLII